MIPFSRFLFLFFEKQKIGIGIASENSIVDAMAIFNPEISCTTSPWLVSCFEAYVIIILPHIACDLVLVSMRITYPEVLNQVLCLIIIRNRAPRLVVWLGYLNHLRAHCFGHFNTDVLFCKSWSCSSSPNRPLILPYLDLQLHVLLALYISLNPEARIRKYGRKYAPLTVGRDNGQIAHDEALGRICICNFHSLRSHKSRWPLGSEKDKARRR